MLNHHRTINMSYTVINFDCVTPSVRLVYNVRLFGARELRAGISLVKKILLSTDIMQSMMPRGNEAEHKAIIMYKVGKR